MIFTGICLRWKRPWKKFIKLVLTRSSSAGMWVVCGHTHMQFDRMIGQTRVVNAGSVGEPFGESGAYWLLPGPDVQLRCTSYDLTKAAELIRATQYPQAQESAEGILHPPAESKMLELFGKYELR